LMKSFMRWLECPMVYIALVSTIVISLPLPQTSPHPSPSSHPTTASAAGRHG